MVVLARKEYRIDASKAQDVLKFQNETQYTLEVDQDQFITFAESMYVLKRDKAVTDEERVEQLQKIVDTRAEFVDTAFDIATFRDMTHRRYQHRLQQALDQLDGIQTHYIEDAQFQTGCAYFRDARQSVRLDLRVPQDDPRRLHITLLQRSLSLMRAVFYVVKDGHLATRNICVKSFERLIQLGEKADFVTEEALFNHRLIFLLQKAGLAIWENTHKQDEKLLMHYRNLSALLDPAPSVCTLFGSNELGHYHLEQAHPITQKTATQHSSIANFKFSGRVDLQHAYQAFKPLMFDDQRRLPAQARKSIAPTVKNGYAVCSENIFTDKNMRVQSVKSRWSLRHAALTFLGKGLGRRERREVVTQNLEQLMQAAQSHTDAKHLHVTVLNTHSLQNKQNLIVGDTEAAINKNPEVYSCSYIPVNAEGILRQPRLAKFIPKSCRELSGFYKLELVVRSILTLAFNFFAVAAAFFVPYFKKVRNVYAATTHLVAGHCEGVISSVCCASGQDRTGTNAEIAEDMNIVHCFGDQNIDIDFECAADLHVSAGHNALLATLAAPGSPGLKSDSKVKGLFSKGVEDILYTATAKTNKHVPITQHSDPANKGIFAYHSSNPVIQRIEADKRPVQFGSRLIEV